MGAELHPPTFHFGAESLFSSDPGCRRFTPTAAITQDRPHRQPRRSTMPPRRSASARIPSQGPVAASSRNTPSTLGDNVADCITVSTTASQPEQPPKRIRKPSIKAVEAAAAAANIAVIDDGDGSDEKRSTRTSRKRSLGSVDSSAPPPTPKRLASAIGGQSSIYSEAAFSPVSAPPTRATSARPSFLAPPVGLTAPGIQLIPPPPPLLAPPTPSTNSLGPQLELATQRITDLENRLAEAEKKLREAHNTIDALTGERDEALRAANQDANQAANQEPGYLTTMLEEADAKSYAIQDELDALKLRHEREVTEATEKITTLERQLAHERQHLEAADRTTALEHELAKERQERADLETAHTQQLTKERQEHANIVKALNQEYNRLYDDSIAAGEKARGHIQALRAFTDRVLVGPPRIPATQESTRLTEQQQEPGNLQPRGDSGNQPARPAEETATSAPPNPDPSQHPRAPMATSAESLAAAARMALAEIARNPRQMPKE